MYETKSQGLCFVWYCLSLNLFGDELYWFPLLLEQNNTNGKRTKLVGSKYENGSPKAEAEASSVGGDKPAEKETEPSEPPKQDYIHVRARRGQATDSHSLAERVMLIKSFVACNFW